MITGPIHAVLSRCPKLKFLELRDFEYNVDWSGLPEAAKLRSLELWNYEDIDNTVRFPPLCKVDFHGLVTHYTRDPKAVTNFMRTATEGCKNWNWRIGCYDMHHQSILQSIKDKQPLTQGSDKEELDHPHHVTADPPQEA